VTVATADLSAWLTTRRAEVDRALERWLPGPPAAPPILSQAMHYSLMAGGKRLRPMLALAAAEATADAAGASVEAAADLALPAACALEMIHTYSLVHDDLPAMDNDTLRRGRPTSHVVHGEGMAILAGDGLLTEAFALIAREPIAARDISAAELASRKLRTVQAIADAAGPAGMVGGQAVDLRAVTEGITLDAEAVRAMHAMKTGALITGSARAGAIMAGADDTTLAAITEFGAHLGLAFQIVDDVLDVEGASAELGKTAGKDAAAGKPTYPALFGLDASKRLAAEAIERALAALASARLQGQLPAIARWVVSRTH
jgi:geranylgeranyl diphosphate synthase type II